jgi:gluconolactonase
MLYTIRTTNKIVSVIKILFLLLSLSFSSVTAQSLVPQDSKLELIANGFQFVEGPVWNDTLGLLFSDMNGNRIYKWNELDSISIFLNPSANSNGLTYDLEGRLIIAQTGLRRVCRLEFNGTQTSLADNYNGKKLNSPNDLAVKSDGSIFFTDPPFNIPAGQHQELSFSGIFRISPSGELQILDSTLALPNGICFSPDESKLYVNDSQARIIYIWDVINDSTITNKKVFASISPIGYADGMKVDENGNLFSAGPLGIWAFSKSGTLLDTILVPGQASNCNWGDEDRKTLYITGGNSVYRIRLGSITDIKEQGILEPDFELYQNYPNPFNPVTKIKYALSDKEFTTITIFDVLGNEIAELVNGEMSAGEHEVEFLASNNSDFKLCSGIYFYQLKAGDFCQTKKLILLK